MKQERILRIYETTSEQLKNEIVTEIREEIKLLTQNLQPQKQIEWLTRQETADLLSVSLVTLWAWNKNEILVAYRIGNKVRYKRSEVENALTKMC